LLAARRRPTDRARAGVRRHPPVGAPRRESPHDWGVSRARRRGTRHVALPSKHLDFVCWLSISTTGGSVAAQESVIALQERLANEQRLVHLIDRIHSAKTLDSIFIEIQGEMLT